MSDRHRVPRNQRARRPPAAPLTTPSRAAADKAGPLGPGERPLLFCTPFEAAVDVADIELHRRLLVPASVLVLQKASEEPFLQGNAVVGVELGEVFETVDFEPLVARRDSRICLEVPASMQMMRPVRRG